MRWPRIVTLTGLVGALAFAGLQAPARAGSRVHVVEPGDTLWELAEDNGCTVDKLRAANGMGYDDPLVIGTKLDISVCPGTKRGASDREYVVVAGDSLSAIARHQGTTIEELRQLNDLDGSLIRVGQRLRVPGEAKREVRLLQGQSRGSPGHGWLHAPTQLPRSGHYYRRRVERTWAAAHVVDRTLNAVHDARAQFPKLHRLAIGDLSDKDGGPLGGHASHQSGRDIDIGLYYRRVPAGYPQEFVAATKSTIDAPATWALLESLIRTVGQPGGVEKVFVDYELQGWLYEAARADGWSKARLRDVFQYPDGQWSKHGIVRHEPLHDDHLHVRFGCPPDDGACR